MSSHHITGGSLESYLRKQRNSNSNISEQQQLRWIIGIAKGMFHLHHEKLIHRDIAARNMLVSVTDHASGL